MMKPRKMQTPQKKKQRWRTRGKGQRQLKINKTIKKNYFTTMDARSKKMCFQPANKAKWPKIWDK